MVRAERLFGPTPPPRNVVDGDGKKIMEKESIELPLVCTGPADDRWRIEFKVYNGYSTGWANNVSRAAAENFLRKVTAKSDDLALSCSRCPEATYIECPHDPPRWRYSEMTDARIMPMREAL